MNSLLTWALTTRLNAFNFFFLRKSVFECRLWLFSHCYTICSRSRLWALFCKWGKESERGGALTSQRVQNSKSGFFRGHAWRFYHFGIGFLKHCVSTWRVSILILKNLSAAPYWTVCRYYNTVILWQKAHQFKQHSPRVNTVCTYTVGKEKTEQTVMSFFVTSALFILYMVYFLGSVNCLDVQLMIYCM